MITKFKLFENKKDIPNWFYLVLRFHEEQQETTLDSLMRMELIQLKGISDSYGISKSWFDIRDLLIVMNGSDVSKLNTIEPIVYYDPDSFCKNNFKFWRRVIMSEPFFIRKYDDGRKKDTAFNGAIIKIFQNLPNKNVRDNKKGGLNISYMYDKNGVIKFLERSHYRISEEFDDLYHNGQLHINNFNDFVKKTFEIVKNYTKDYPLSKDYPFENWKSTEDYIINNLTLSELKKILVVPFKYISKVYDKEGEWSVSGKSFKIPRGSILYFKETGGSDKERYESRGLEKEQINKLVEQYGLDQIYQIKTVQSCNQMTDILKNEYNNE